MLHLLKIALGSMASVAGVAAVLLAQPRLREWCYRETSYRVILSRTLQATDALTPEAITLRIADYVHRQVYQGGGSVIDADAWTHLVRGIGWCDQKAWAIGTLLALRGIHSRLVFLSNQRQDGGHVVLEVLLNGRWCLLDPSYDFLLRMPDGSAGGLDSLSEDVTLVMRQPVFLALRPEARAEVFESYARLFPPREPLQRPPVRWPSILDARRGDPRRAAAERAVVWLWNTFGTAWAYPLQDLYLALLRPPPPEADGGILGDLERGSSMRELALARRQYYRARNYHLYRRRDEAQRCYRWILARYPDTLYARRAAFWLGSLAASNGDTGTAVQTFDQLLQRWPELEWRTRVYERLARAYAKQGAGEKAEAYEREALGDPLVSTASRIARRAQAVGLRP